MLSYPHRFHGYNSFRYVYRNGQTVRNPSIALKYALNERRKVWRCGIVVSRKVSKSAVVRNRIRRRIYEVVRTQTDNIKKPYDMVFTVFDEPVAAMPHDELAKLIVGNLTSAAIIPSKLSAQDKRGAISDLTTIQKGGVDIDKLLKHL